MQINYKIAMIGFGSIGKRHLINIDRVLKNKRIDYSIDLIRRSNSASIDEESKNMITTIYTDNQDLPDDYDVIFITNPTHLHFDTIKKYCNLTKHMFIEKPVFDETSVDLLELPLKSKGVYYVACPLRYTAVIQYIKKEIDLASVYSARAICSSYLPNWRPGQDYRETYSAHLNQGGGVSIDLIHEWDYMMYLFGKPNKVMNYRGQYSNLEIDSDDLSVYIAEYDGMLAEVHLDYFGRKTIRELQLITSDETIVADLTNSEVRFLSENKVVKFNEDRNAYQCNEIEHFFDIIEGRTTNENDIRIAFDTLKIAKDGKL